MARADVRAVITAEDRASNVISGVGGSVGKMAGAFAIGTLAVQGMTRAFQALQDAAKFAINVAADIEQAGIAFEVMLGSADDARRLLSQLSEFAIKTPFDLPQLVEGTKRLLAYNIEADKLLPTLDALGNIAAGVGRDKLPQLILAFGQVRAAGKLTGQELRQFTEAGVPLLEILAEQAGVSAGEIKEAMESGAAPSFAEVEQAIFSMSQEGGKFFNLLGRQAETFGGVVSNIKDQFVRIAADIVGVDIEAGGIIEENGLFAKSKQAAEFLLNFLDANQETIVAFFQGIFGAVNQVSDAVGRLVNEFRNLWNSLSTQEQQAIRDLAFVIGTVLGGALRGILQLVIQAIDRVTSLIREFRNLRENISTGRFDIGNIGGLIGRGIRLALPGFQHGGQIPANQPAIIGEAGPELFVPRQSGTIIPNDRLGGQTNITIAPQIGVFAGSNQERRKLAKMLLDDMKDIASQQGVSLTSLLGA